MSLSFFKLNNKFGSLGFTKKLNRQTYPTLEEKANIFLVFKPAYCVINKSSQQRFPGQIFRCNPMNFFFLDFSWRFLDIIFSHFQDICLCC